jgi:hypothetical protein
MQEVWNAKVEMMKWMVVQKKGHVFIKDDIARNIDVVGRNMKTLVTFVERAIAKKNTLFRAEL